MSALKLPLYIKSIREDADSEPSEYALCDMTGETIMINTSEAVCREIMNVCNRQYREKKTGQERYGQVLCYYHVPIVPMEKPASQVVTVDKDGNQVVANSPAYNRYIREFARLIKESGQIVPIVPIECRCQVIVKAYSNTTIGRSIPAYVESTLDGLVAAGILKNKGYKIVNNIDGSRIYCDEIRPRLEIFIRKWVNNAG